MTNRLIKKEKIHMSRIHELIVLLPLIIFWDRNDMGKWITDRLRGIAFLSQ